MTKPAERRGLDVAAVRDHFPALARRLGDRVVAFLDGAAGTQLPRESIEAMTRYLESGGANRGGAFQVSRETDALVSEARAATADFLGAHEPDEIIFGPNMTTLTFAVSRALARDLSPGDELVVSRLDHDANVAPWLEVAADRGAVVRWLELDPDHGSLELDGLEELVGGRTRIVALTLASNVTGSIIDVGRAIEVAHAAGAVAFVDAVHAAPHLPIDVSAMQADMLVCSPYKFFAPHLGVLYGRRDLLQRLRAYRVRPAGEALPGKLETGTGSWESLAGLVGTFGYLEGLGRAYGDTAPGADRRTVLHAAMAAIRTYERELSGPLLDGLRSVPGLTVFGVVDGDRLDQRVPTVAFTISGMHPRRVAEHLAERAINVWDGDLYAVELVRRLGLDRSGGLLRVGLVHYNTLGEIGRLTEALRELPASPVAG